MFHNKQEKFSLRKYKDGRTDSKLIGATILATGVALSVGASPVSAAISSNGTDTATLVSDTSKVDSTSVTTFTDDQDPTKKVTVDAVIGKVVSLPTKANENTGNADGTDSVKFTSKATVNYLLEDDHSKLQDSKIVDGNSGTINTPYDRKGIAADVDGKDYRESTVEKTGSVDENTGKEEKIQANNKEYQLVRSEVIDADKAAYEKTQFNNIEASVSPEGMHNNLGEINYGKITGKVYLVEETSNGQYGKFVEATNINSDEEAVEAWKNGQATAKDFTKENVSLQKGDTILVLDRDTYAHGSGKRTVNTVKYRRELVRATPEFNRVESSEEIKDVNAYPTYALENETVSGNYVTAGADHNFGTSDDGEITFNREQYLLYRYGPKLENSLPEVKDTPELDFSKSSLNEIMRYMQSEIFGVLEYFDYYAKTDAERQLIQERRTKLEQNIADTIQMIKNENISMAAARPDDRYTTGLVFYSPDREKLTALKKQIESAENLLDEIMFTLNTHEEVVKQYDNLKNVNKITKEVLYYEANHKSIDGYRYGYPKFSHRIITSYHKDAVPEHYSDWEIEYPEIEEIDHSVLTNKGAVTISDDLSKIKVVNGNQKTTETEFTKQDVATKEATDYVVKEIITPVRAYKVMDEGGPVVNHYYRMQITRESEAYSMEAVGGVRIKYLTTEGKELKTEIVRELGKVYELNVYNQYSGNTKVGERRVENIIDADYDTTAKQYPILKDAKTGFTYEYVGLKQGSPAASGKVVAGITEVIYEYGLVSEEDPNPAKKEEKGSVVVKYVDADGKEIKNPESVVTDAVVKTTKTYTTKSVDVVVSTRDEVENHDVEYNTADKKVKTITKDGKKYNFHGIYAVSDKFNNTTAETGKVVEGITTIVYQYQLEPEKVQWEVSQNPPIVEVPEFTGGTSLPEAPINEVPDYVGGTVVLEPPIYMKSTLIITKWVDENGTPLKSADVKAPVELGQPNEAFEHGTIEGYEYVETIRNHEGNVVTHVFRKLNSESKFEPKPEPKSESKPESNPEPTPTPTPQRNEEETPNVPNKPVPSTYPSGGNTYPAPSREVSQLPNTGTESNAALAAFGFVGILSGLSLVLRKKDSE